MPRFDAPKRPPDSFGVEHYAGKVNYSSLLLMDKNKDFVIAEHAALLTASGFQFARCIAGMAVFFLFSCDMIHYCFS